MKKFIAAILAAAQVFGGSIAVFGAEEALMPIESGEAVITENGGVVTIDTGSYYKASADGVSLMAADKYNSDIEDLEYVSSVKNQGSYNVCWSFAGTSAFETAAMKADNKSGGDYDFSEAHLAVATSDLCLDDNGGGFLRDYDEGGNGAFVLSYLTRDTNEGRYNGSVEDSDYPYEMMSDAGKASSENMNKDVTDYFPQTYIGLNFGDEALSDSERTAQTEKIKSIVKEYGAAVVSIRCGESSDNADEGFLVTESGDKVFYYNDQGAEVNHDVCIVGYDDEYSKENFSGFSSALSSGGSLYSTAPKSDGAFIVKNSWGESWGNNGYFYMSYETAIRQLSAYGDVISRSSFENTYETAHYGCNYTSYYTQGSAAVGGCGNVFEAESEGEKLNYVGIWTFAQGTYVKFYVNPDADVNIFNSDSLAEVKLNTDLDYDSEKGYYIDEQGYRVFELAEPVEITGKKFTVAADLYNEAGSGAIPIEADCSYYNVNAQDGIGYMYTCVEELKSIEAGDYYEALEDFDINTLYSGNIVLKAYTASEKSETETSTETTTETSTETTTEINTVKDGAVVVDSDTGEIVGYDTSSASDEIIIPEEIDGVKVTSIGEKAFANLSSVEAVFIPNTIETIADTAFDNSPNTVIYCDITSKAKEFAEENEVNYAIVGDADSDGKLSAADAVIVLKYARNKDDVGIFGEYGLRASKYIIVNENKKSVTARSAAKVFAKSKNIDFDIFS